MESIMNQDKVENQFAYNRKIAVIIGVSKYDELRKEEAFKDIKDLPAVKEDLKTIELGVMHLGFTKDEIQVMEEPSFADIKKTMYTVQNKIYNANEEGEKTLLFVYYAGHGIQSNMTQIITNGGQKFKYPLEYMLRCFGKLEGAFVFSLFDCCREKVNPELEK